ncbi:MAG TPA: YiiX/YebB-like N1pC/P60 family cysteine hydrolase [Opitutales bacterium]|nr:YiiX/YebB-like N1pC/P60 family cysteine hydrolase [Opitutales bacterium]
MQRDSSSSNRFSRSRKWFAFTSATLLVVCSVLACCIWHPFHTVPRLDAALLHDGDIILIRGDTVRGFAVVNAGDGFPYSHAGIVRVEEGGSFVIHATPDGRTDWVIRDTLTDFLANSDARFAAIYRIGSGPEAETTARAASDNAQGYYEQKRRFDAAFSLAETQELYCTELVWRAYLEAGRDISEGRRSPAPSFLTKEPVLMPQELVAAPDARLVEESF